jgi:small subunit ribosomal protein S4
VACTDRSVCKLCRRENLKLFLKGDRCFTDKCSFDRRPYPPGQHGQSRMKFSEFALQLREKQKAKRFYGIAERQFRRYFSIADRSKGVTGTALLALLETRLDSVVYAMGYAASRREARHLVSHGHIMVNGTGVNIASFNVRKGDKIEIKESSRQMSRILAAIEGIAKRTLPNWVEVDHSKFTGMVKEVPNRDDITLPVEENMIVEYYSR